MTSRKVEDLAMVNLHDYLKKHLSHVSSAGLEVNPAADDAESPSRNNIIIWPNTDPYFDHGIGRIGSPDFRQLKPNEAAKKQLGAVLHNKPKR